MIRRPPRSTLFPYNDALPISFDGAHLAALGLHGQHGAGLDGVAVDDDGAGPALAGVAAHIDRKSTRLNSSHGYISYAVFCLKKKKYDILPAEVAASSSVRTTA